MLIQVTIFSLLWTILDSELDLQDVHKTDGCGVQNECVTDEQNGRYEPFTINWMSRLPDRTMLHWITLPGTHDTMAHHHVAGGPRLTTQSMRLRAQLEAGIRVLDIRLARFGDSLRVHHRGRFLSCNLQNVLDICQRFLERNPSEVVFVRLKPEKGAHPIWVSAYRKFRDFMIGPGEAENFDEALQSYLRQYRDIILPSRLVGYASHQETRSITLGSARGKIVILQFFPPLTDDSEPYGPPWPEEASNPDQIQCDWWLVNGDAFHRKWSKITEHIKQMQSNEGLIRDQILTHKIYAVALSGTGIFYAPHQVACGDGRKVAPPPLRYLYRNGTLHDITHESSPNPSLYSHTYDCIYHPRNRYCRLHDRYNCPLHNREQENVDDNNDNRNNYNNANNVAEQQLLGSNLTTEQLLSEGMNQVFLKFISLNRFSFLGIVFTDFPSCKLIRTIIDINFEYFRYI